MHYIICKSNFEYNDEIFYNSEIPGGEPIFVTGSKNEVIEKYLELEITAVKEHDLYEYGYSFDEVINTNVYEDVIGNPNELDEGYPWALPARLKDEDIEELIIRNGILVKFYCIFELEEGKVNDGRPKIIGSRDIIEHFSRSKTS
jgi:hypothetical protein